MFACKICIMKKGLRGSEIASLPKTQEEFVEHLETVHHIAAKPRSRPRRACGASIRKSPTARSAK